MSRSPTQGHDAPLVTFALFAYNQEDYVAEAVQGALAQTYSPLEVILSDDCSTDRTFAIMQRIAAEYQGPHRVRAVQTAQNLGVVRHVIARGREASGEIVVVAGGDDISKPQRVHDIVRTFQAADDIWAVTTGYDLIDAEGLIISENVAQPIVLARGRKLQSNLNETVLDHHWIQGATAAYRKLVFQLPLPQSFNATEEDSLLGFLIYSNGGRVSPVSAALIRYRMHERALGNKPPSIRSRIFESDGEDEVSAARLAREHALTLLWIAQHCRYPQYVNIERLRRYLHFCEIRTSWPQRSIQSRLASVFRDLLCAEPFGMKWRIARIFGTQSRYQPRTWLSRF